MLAAVVTGFVVTVALEPVVISRLLKRSMVDVPGERSSHLVPTPRGGGLAVVAGIAGGVLVAREGTAAFLLPAVLIAASTGAVEDVRGLSIRARLLLTAAAALALVAGLVNQLDVSSGDVVVLALAVPWTLAVVNAVNFMDGINGISVATGVIAGGAYALFGLIADNDALTVLGAATAAAAAGFAPYNMPRARVFLGDVGSYGLGAALAALSVLAVLEGLPVEAAVAPLLIYLADTGWTLLRRLRAGEPLHLPHKRHIYQRLVAAGWPHLTVTAVVAVLTLACACLGAVSLYAGPVVRLVALAALGAVVAVYLTLPRLAIGRGVAA